MRILQCPYCGDELEEDRNFCCSEAGHGEWVNVCELCEEEPVEENVALCKPCGMFNHD